MKLPYTAILLVSRNARKMYKAIEPFRREGFEVQESASIDEALSMIVPDAPPALVLIDAMEMDENALRECVMRIISRSALTWVTAVTSLGGEEYHDAMEGLGMLPPLPQNPSVSDGETLLSELRHFLPRA